MFGTIANLIIFLAKIDLSMRRIKSAGVIGVMSGTSLDGLDLCFAQFQMEGDNWRILNMQTRALDYSPIWRKNLSEAFDLTSEDLKQLDRSFGQFIGSSVVDFMTDFQLTDRVDFVASHGHTVFHQPEKGITVQIGNGQLISDRTGKMVVSDFRKKDVELGGQGAPLVPLGDHFLFSEYDACLNLGGIANISFVENEQRKAFDIAPCNLPLNKIMREEFKREFDQYGALASSGSIDSQLLESLNRLNFYEIIGPKSLGIEWLNTHFYPLLEEAKLRSIPAIDRLRTIIEHETQQIANCMKRKEIKSVLLTGGGAFNTFFIDELRMKTKAELHVPSPEIVAFKEALIFAFLGLRTVRGEVNALKSVTGASHDSIGGIITHPSTVQNF